MSIGFLRNDQEFTSGKPDEQFIEDDLDFESMWNEGLNSSSVEARVARADFNRRLY